MLATAFARIVVILALATGASAAWAATIPTL